MEIINHILSALSRILKYLVEWIDFIIAYWKYIVVIIIVMWISLKIIDLLLAWTSRRSVIATVTHKERVYYPKSLNSMYLIFTDQGVFRNQDSWAFLSFNSSDTYREIQVGSTYKFTVYGYRNQWNSEYPNVLKITPKTV